jgi:iron-sulfur cluster insertion protein
MILEISPNAKLRLMEVLKNGESLVISVTPGGCNGFSYNYTITHELPEDSHRVNNNPSVYVLNSAIDMLKSGILQYESDDLGTAFFSIINPNATSKCGCGNSFSTF